MSQSDNLFTEAQKYIPGGVNSPVRAFSSVGGDPIYMTNGKGSVITSVDGREFIDFCGSWGPLILGHADPDVVEAVQKTAAQGLSFGTCCSQEVEMARLICELSPGMDKIRMVTSGTEATMTALRLARGYTGREGVVKFAGCYHGHHDAMLVSAGSGLLTQGQTSSAGVTKGAVESVSVLPYNDSEAVTAYMTELGSQTAAIIVEPIAGNMGLIDPGKEYLQLLRDLCTEHGAVLIFDEVISGFRLGPSPYGAMVGITADLTCLGKIIGGGMPIGAVGGREEIMNCLAPVGPVYQAGTLSGNPVALAAGITTLIKLRETNPYPRLAELCSQMAEEVNNFSKSHDLNFHMAHKGGLFTPFFSKGEITCLEDAKKCDTEAFTAFHQFMLGKGIYLPPSQFETGFFSATHGEDEARSLTESIIGFLKKPV